MQTTYHVKPSEVNDSFTKAIRKLYGEEEELIITVTSKEKAQPKSADEKEPLFYSLFGSWQGDETGDELVEKIYSDRVSGTGDVDL